MKKILLFFVCMAWVSVVFADSYMGVSPGTSMKADADRAFGASIREVEPGVRYDYAPEEHDARRVSVCVYPQTQIVQTIDIYFKEPYDRSQVVGWFDLTGSTKKEIDAKGNHIEYFLPQAIALHYQGPNEDSPIIYLSHFDPKMLGQKDGMPRVDPTTSAGRLPQAGMKPYLGVQIAGHAGAGIKVIGVTNGSPAYKAGLRSGDYIVAIEQHEFFASGINPQQFVEVISMMPVEKPLRFVIQRQGIQLEVAIALTEISEQELAKTTQKNIDEAEAAFTEGEACFARGEFNAAVNNFQQAITRNPGEQKYYTHLANAYYERGDSSYALGALQKAIELKETFYPFYMTGKIYLENKQYADAMLPLRRAMKLTTKDTQANADKAEQLLGICYFGLDQPHDAMATFLKLYKKNRKRADPVTLYYLAASFDRMGNARDAIYYYKQYLSKKHGDTKMETLARTRIKALKYNPKQTQQSADSFIKVFDAVAQEMKSFNAN